MSTELAEKSILGTMLKENYLILDSGIKEAFFSTQIHKNIFSSMRELAAKNRPVDYITIMTMKEPVELGGANYLADLQQFSSPTKFDEYRAIIINVWKEREKTRILQLAQADNWSIQEIQKALDTLEDDIDTEINPSIKSDLIDQYERPFKQVEKEIATTTGLNDLDKLLNGFRDSEFIIVAARPSMGKTDILNHFALHAGWSNRLPIIFSLEMSRKSMVDRLIASVGSYNRLKMRNPYEYFTDKQKNEWATSLGRLDKAYIQIDESSALKVSQIKARARKIIRDNQNRKPIIFIDYLQLIRPERLIDNKTQEIGEISSALKQMAKEFNCPVVCLSQLNRGVENRQDKRPLMSDLRDSGNIEQDADVIAFLYREDYYNKETDAQNILEIIVSKHRNGPTGTVSVVYIKETGKLYNIDWSKQRGVS